MSHGPRTLELDRISKTFGSFTALQPMSLHVAAGEMMALLGPSGCGKTTTLRIIAGFSTPDAGSVLIGGQDVTELPPNRRQLGMVFQNYSLFPHMNVAENIAFGLNMRRCGRSETERRVREALDMVRLGTHADRAIHQLSGGQQQRVALARSLVTDPSILLLDEPLGALDRSLRESMQFELRELQRRLGITAIIVTHDQEEALTMSDRIAVMANGRIVQTGTPAEIYERPRTRFVSEFLGTANVLPGVVVGRAGDRLRIRLDHGGIELEAPTARPREMGSRVEVALRPERMTITSRGEGLPARLRATVFRGGYQACEFDIQGLDRPVYVYSPTAMNLAPGAELGLGFDPAYPILLEDEVAA